MDAASIALQAGIVGGGGAGFPTHVKLSAKADWFIVNAAECEPLIEVDKYLVRTRARELAIGAAEMARAVGAARVVFATKKAYGREISCLNDAIKAIGASAQAALLSSAQPGSPSSVQPGSPSSAQLASTSSVRPASPSSTQPPESSVPPPVSSPPPPMPSPPLPDMSVFGMKTFYPAGDEQLISLLVTGRTVPERGIPLDVGAVVDNVSTVLNFYDAMHGKPVTHRVLSVTGAVRQPLVLRVPIGTPVRMCVEAAGANFINSSATGSSAACSGTAGSGTAGSGTAGNYAIVMGGPMMGKYYAASEIDSLFVKKTDGNILVLPPGHNLSAMAATDILMLQNRARSACIRCGTCTDLCPRYLSGHNVTPHLVMRNFYRIDRIPDNDEFERAFGSAANCSECGVCEHYSCPMRLSPRRVNAYVKTRLAERAVNPERNLKPAARAYMDERLVPTSRLAARLGISRYATGHLGDALTELKPAKVCMSLKQNIGAPSIPLVSEGAQVSEGDLIAAPPEKKLGANLHASISGVVASIGKDAIVIYS